MGYALLTEKPLLGTNFSPRPKSASERAADRWFTRENSPVSTTVASDKLLHTNHLNAPELITDQNQNVVWDATYEPFGKATLHKEDIVNNLRAPNQLWDEETGFHYNLQRYLDPNLGRYNTSDRIGLADGNNTYGYAAQNPIKYFDPNGESIICWFWGCKGDAELPPTDRMEPEKPKKPKRPKCNNSTTNFNACITCCGTTRGSMASGGGTACHEECMRQQGMTRNNSEGAMTCKT